MHKFRIGKVFLLARGNAFQNLYLEFGPISNPFYIKKTKLDQGAGEEANSPAGGARGVGGVVVGGVSIFTRKFEEGNRSLFLGGSFVQCDDIPLIMAGGKIQSRK